MNSKETKQQSTQNEGCSKFDVSAYLRHDTTVAQERIEQFQFSVQVELFADCS